MILAAIQHKEKPVEYRLCGATVGTMIRTKQNIHPTIGRKHQIILLQKKKLKRDYCHKEGHTIERCYKKKNKDRKENKDHHMVCIAIDGDNDFPLCNEMTLLHRAGKDKHDASLREKYNMARDTFVFDSGATSHMRFSKDGMVILKPLKIAIKVGNAENIYSEAIGTFKWLVTQKDCSTLPITLENVLYMSTYFL
jgi:hypothetical protein